MDRIRRSLRDSFRRRSSSGSPSERHVGGGGNGGDSSKLQIWSQDEAAVRAGTCSYSVKYLGSVEVSESRGMQICEEALKILRASRRRPIKGVLYVSGDGLRVVDSENKGLVVDQTIEKVSFCAPDRNHEKGFAYICRDGTTRRWMCHGFHAVKDSGERLSHAVGCAFAVCLERKQKRDREAQQLTQSQSSNVTPSHAPSSITQTSKITAPFERQGSFRQAALNERLQDPQNLKPAEKPAVRPAINPHAVARPQGNRHVFERQGSLRMPFVPLKETSNTSNTTSTTTGTNQDMFRRFNSLRLNQLPSNLARHDQAKNTFGPSAILEEEFSPRINETTKSSTFGGITNFYGAQSNSSYFSPPASELGSPTSQTRSASFDAPFANGQGNYATSKDQAFVRGIDKTTPSSANSSLRLRGDEWLQSATKQAKILQQYRMSPPVTESVQSEIRPSVVSPPSFAPPPLPTQQQIPRTGSNAKEVFQHSRANTFDFGSQPTMISSAKDLSNSAVSQTTATTDFDSRWNELVEAEQRRHSTTLDGVSGIFSRGQPVSSTNPFNKESSSVNI